MVIQALLASSCHPMGGIISTTIIPVKMEYQHNNIDRALDMSNQKGQAEVFDRLR